METPSRLAILLVALAGWSVATAQESAPATPPADSNQPPAPPEVTYYGYKVVRSYPHDRQAFTQGLVYENGFIYEGTGLYGRSAIVRWDLKTGNIMKRLRLPDRYFGEGIVVFGDKLIELTWKSNLGFVYSKDTFTLRGQFNYPTQGWGITHDGQRLILSDGTATLRFLDPNTYAETGRLDVLDRGRPIRRLNELEYVPGPPAGVPDTPSAAPGPRIYANVWSTDHIVVICPKTGRVTGWIDLTGLYAGPTPRHSDAVLNGIAWRPETKHLLVTGKLWPQLYEIELKPEPQVGTTGRAGLRAGITQGDDR
jgi:glutamine cyclotransferase